MRAAILSIGDELISGASLDTNSAWLADRLTQLGAEMAHHITVGDDVQAIETAIRAALHSCDWVLISGGLGPTEDDRTRHALSAAMGQPLEFDDESWQRIQAYFAHVGRIVPPSNRVQAERPHGSRAIPNAWGTAPGIVAVIGKCRIFVMPGVPREMKAMFEHEILPVLLADSGGKTKVRIELHCFGMGEAQIGEHIRSFMQFGRNPTVGTRAADGVISLRITAAAGSGAEARRMAESDALEIQELLGDTIFGRDADTLASVVGRKLLERGLTVATAESCTAGLLGAELTEVAGSSAYFVGGFLTYSNAMKTSILGVPRETLECSGAVSEETAAAMAEGARGKAGSEIALAVTGIAGPGGGTAEKPVGTVCISLADLAGTITRTLRIPTELGRAGIRVRSVQSALDMLRRRLMDSQQGSSASDPHQRNPRNHA